MANRFYLDSVALSLGWTASTVENQALANSGSLTNATDTATLSKGATDESAFAWTADANEPNNADWPAGSYHAVISVNSIGADLSLTGASLFVAVSSDLSSALRSASVSAGGSWDSTTGTGLKTATITWNPAAGNASDRYGFRLNVTNGAQHQTQDLTLNLGTTSTYIDGPFPVNASTTLNVQDVNVYDSLNDVGNSTTATYSLYDAGQFSGPAYRDSVTFSGSTTQTISLQVPTGTTSGDVIYWYVGVTDDVTVDVGSTGVVQISASSAPDSNYPKVFLFWKEYTSGGPFNVTASVSTDHVGIGYSFADSANQEALSNSYNSNLLSSLGLTHSYTSLTGGRPYWLIATTFNTAPATILDALASTSLGLTDAAQVSTASIAAYGVVSRIQAPSTVNVTVTADYLSSYYHRWGLLYLPWPAPATGNVNVTLGVQDASLTQYSPTVSTDAAITLGVQDVSLTQYSVTVGVGASVTLGVQDVSLTQFSTSVTGDSSYTANVQDASLTQFSPTVSTGASTTLSVQDVSLTQYSVSVTEGYGVNVTVPTLAGGGGTIGDDTFTEAGTGTANLNTHTAETGGTWTKRWTEPGVTRDILIDKDNDRATMPTTAFVYGDATLADVAYSLGSTTMGDGYIEAQMPGGSLGSSWLVARQPTDNLDTFYFVKTDGAGNNTLYLFRNTDYSYVQIASLGSTSGDWIRFRVAGSSPTTLQVERRATQGALGTGWHIDTTDNTAANQVSSGYIGIAGEYDDDIGDITGTVDNFKAVSESGGGTFGAVVGQNAVTVSTPTNSIVGPQDVSLTQYSVSVSTDQSLTLNVQDASLTQYAVDVTTALNAAVTLEVQDASLTQYSPTVGEGVGTTLAVQDASLTQFSASVSTGADTEVGPLDASVNVFSVSVAAGGSVSEIIGPQDVSLTQFSASVTGDSAYTANVQDASLTQFPVSVTGDSSYQIFMVDAQVNVHSVSVSAGGNVESIVGPLDASITQYSVSVTAGNDVDSVVGPQNVSVTQYAVEVQNVNDFGLNVQNASLTQYSVSTSQGVGSEVGPQSASITPYSLTVTTEQLLTLNVQDATVDVYPVNVATPNDVVVGPVTATVTPYSVTVDTTSTVSEVIGPNNVITSALPVQVTFGVGVSTNLQSLTIGQYPVVAGIGEESVLNVQDISLSSHTPSVTLGAGVVLGARSVHISQLPVSAIGEDPLAYQPPTLSTLRGSIQRDIRDPNAAVFDPEEVNDFINEAIAMLNTMSPFENKEAVASTNAVDGAFPTQLSYVWRVEVNATGFTEAPPIPPHNSEERGPRRGWFFWNGIVQIGDWWWEWLNRFEAATLTFWGYEVRDPMTLDAQVAQFQSLDEEFTVRKYARVLAFRRLQNERSLFQQWQNLPKNTDISANQLSQMVMSAESEYEKYARKHAVLRRPPEG